MRQNGLRTIRQIEKIHLTATTPDGQVLALVSYPGERCGITLNGQPIEGLEWPITRIEECAAAFARLAGLKR